MKYKLLNVVVGVKILEEPAMQIGSVVRPAYNAQHTLYVDDVDNEMHKVVFDSGDVGIVLRSDYRIDKKDLNRSAKIDHVIRQRTDNADLYLSDPCATLHYLVSMSKGIFWFRSFWVVPIEYQLSGDERNSLIVSGFDPVIPL